MKIRIIPILLLLLSITNFISAQDKIIKKNKKVIECTITEVGSVEIKYKLPDFPSDIIFSIDKEKVRKVIFSNGKVLEFKSEFENEENYSDNRLNAIKFQLFSPVQGFTSLGYEKSIKAGRTIEGTLGIIGLGMDNLDEEPIGLFFKFGYKFLKTPDFYLRNMRYSHLLKGSYVKPELGIVLFERYNHIYDYANQNSVPKRVSEFSMAFQLIFGKQWIFDNIFLVDMNFGFGYALSNRNEPSIHYAYSVMGNDFPICFSSALKIGFLF